MNAMSASRAEAAQASPGGRKVLIWDAPVRVFHWLMVASFAGAWLTAESERWRMVHVTLGYTMGGLVVFRLLWGLMGTRHARFANFVRGPATVLRYLRGILSGKPEHHTGHNPAGALAILALLGFTLVVTASGWATFNEIGGRWPEKLHEAAASVMLAIVAAHVAGAIFTSLQHRENLIGAMISGRKLARPEEAVRSAWRTVAAMMLLAVLGFWWLQWQSSPLGGGFAEPSVATAKIRQHEHHPHEHRQN